jgi:hypothetical protein
VQGEQLARRGLADGQTWMQVSTVNGPSISLKGPVKVPQKKNSAAPSAPPRLELVFEQRLRVSSWEEPRSSDPFSGWADCGHGTNR